MSGRPAGVASPTQTKFEITFLNSSNVELGTTSYDLRSDPTTLAWRVKTDKVVATGSDRHDESAVEGRGTKHGGQLLCLGTGRVLRQLSCCRITSFPGANRLSLTNGDLNTPGAPAGWTVTEGPTVNQGAGPVTADSVAFIAFANRLSNTPNPNPAPPYATLPTGQQGHVATALRQRNAISNRICSTSSATRRRSSPVRRVHEYTFSAWSAWESGYSGGLLRIRRPRPS